MSILKYISYSCFLFGMVSSAWAEKSDRVRWSFGFEGHEYIYKETVDNAFFMRDQGKMWGSYAGMKWSPQQHPLFVEFQARSTQSNHIHYKSNGTGSADKGKYRTYEVRLLSGYRLDETGSTWEPYLGLGFRNLVNDDQGIITSTGHAGYYRESDYFYLPLGLRYEREWKHPYKIQAEIEYDAFIGGNQTSCPGGTITHNYQPKGYGARSSLTLIRVYPSFDLHYSLFIRLWEIEESEPGFGGLEPENRTISYGIRLGIEL